MYFFACVLFAMSVALQAAAIASPRIAHRIHAKRCATSTHVTATGVEHVEPSSSAHQAKPSATGTAANSTTSTSSNSFLSGNQFGQGTFYEPGLGACGLTNSASDFIVAVSEDLFDKYPGYNDVNPNTNPVCNKKITASYQGKSVAVTVVDRCTGCAEKDLDFAPVAFNRLADPSIGRLDNVEWHWS